MSKQDSNVMKFYSQVLTTYWHKLEEETKRGNFGPNFMQAIKNILQKKFDNFEMLLKLKSQRRKKKEQEERELKAAAEKKKVEDQKEKMEEPQKPLENFVQGDGDDDIQYVEQGQAKQQGQQLKQEHQALIKEEDGVSEADEEDIQKDRIIASANQRVEMYLIGQSHKKKYVAKTQKIIIDLENVFVKFKDKQEAFRKINCSLTKIKPSEVKQ